MGIRRPWLALVILLGPAAAHAHDHFADGYGGVSVQNGSTLVGFHTTFSKTLPEPEGVESGVKRLTFLVDVSKHWNAGGTDKSQLNYAAGVRYTFAQKEAQKLLPFVQVLMGGAHVNTDGEGNDDPMLGVGGGVEYVFKTSPGGWAVRGQVDYIVRHEEVKPRLSVGLAYRWVKH